MKNLSISLILVFVIACSPKAIIKNKLAANDIFDFFRYKEGRKANISAHRGGGDYAGYPENCVESFQYIANQIPVVIECDIELTKDSVLVLMHDNSLDRTTSGKGRLLNQNWLEIKDFTLKDNAGTATNFKIPTLDKALEWGRGKVIYTLDVKRNTPYHLVVEAVRKHKAQNYAVIITYDDKQVKTVYDLDPNLMISASIRDMKEYERLQKLGIPDRNLIAFVGTREPNKEFCDFLHQKQICTILGTLGNLDKMAVAKGDDLYKKWVNLGADVLSSDRPIEAYKAIQ
jgi:glycerophosphoryl diester phosphodiesterase